MGGCSPPPEPSIDILQLRLKIRLVITFRLNLSKFLSLYRLFISSSFKCVMKVSHIGRTIFDFRKCRRSILYRHEKITNTSTMKILHRNKFLIEQFI